MSNKLIKVAVVDDHQLFVNSLTLMVNSFENFKVIIEVSSGKQLFIELQKPGAEVDLLLLDVKMPAMSGPEVAQKVSQLFPNIKIVALSMNDTDQAILQMINAGAVAYLMKEIHPTEFETALNAIYNNGNYHSDKSNINFRRLMILEKENLKITPQEKKFLHYAKTDLTYKQIASEMSVSERTVDGYRESLFDKLKVQSRVAMVIEGLKKNLIEL